jgi:CheY-like chemotaxis protein
MGFAAVFPLLKYINSTSLDTDRAYAYLVQYMHKPHNGHPRTILLIEDDRDDQMLFKDALRAVAPAIICDVTSNGLHALEHLANRPHLPELTFLDLNMPMMNGFEFLSAVFRDDRLRGMHIGVMTTSVILNDMKTSKKLGARFYMTKPTSFDMLCKQIVKVLEGNYKGNDYVISTHPLNV